MPAFRRLPPETIGEIFLFSLPPIITRSSVYRLSHVSRRWREVAFSLPGLWTSLRIEKSVLPERIHATIVEWVGRAGALPLSLSIDSPFDIPEEVLEVLVPLSSRIKSLDLTSFDSPVFQQLLESAEADWSILETLSINVGKVSLSKLAASARQLRSVDLRGYAGSPKQILLLPLHQLKELTIHSSLLAREALPILAQCYSLETCEIQIGVPLHPAPSPIPVSSSFIKLPRLTSFTISVESRVDLSSILNHLDLPALTKLTMGVVLPRYASSTRAMMFPAVDFVSFLERSNPKLEELRLLSGSFRPGEFIECMNIIPTLRVLEVIQSSDIYVDDTVLTELAEGRPLLLPNLARLKMTGGNRVIESLIEFIHARWSADEPSILESVSLEDTSAAFSTLSSPSCIPYRM